MGSTPAAPGSPGLTAGSLALDRTVITADSADGALVTAGTSINVTSESTMPTSRIPVTPRTSDRAGLNLGAPLITTGSRCATTSAAAADFLTVAGWVLTSLGWAFATLFVAGFTGVVRKS